MAGGSAKLYTRSGLDWTEKFRGVAEAVAQLPARSALIDGEVVVPDENGRTDFGRLQRALDGGGETLRYYAFDLLELDGEDLAGLPLIERKRRLATLVSDAPDVILYSDHIIGDGREILEQTCRMGLEGIVSKRADKSYISRRTPGWVKSKCSGRDEFVIGGWRRSTKKERPFSSLLLGEFEDGKLRYRSRVGTGFDDARLAEIARKLRPLARKTSPFADAPREAARDAKWARPAPRRRSRLCRTHGGRLSAPPEFHRLARRQAGQPSKGARSDEVYKLILDLTDGVSWPLSLQAAWLSSPA